MVCEETQRLGPALLARREFTPEQAFRSWFMRVRAEEEAIGLGECNNIVLLGVGTAMTISDYSGISTQIVTGQDIVTIVTDHSPGWILKNSEANYIKLINAIVTKLQTVVPICQQGTVVPKIIIGGHSATGGVAWNSLSKLSFLPDGFLGLDPYQGNPIRGTRPVVAKIDVPTLNIGFTETTCRVDVTFGAKAYYQQTPGKNHRVLYVIRNPQSTGDKQRITHCIFTDAGCLSCPAEQGVTWVRSSVFGPSIQAFVRSLTTGVYNKHDYTLPGTIPVDLYVNLDEVSKNKILLNNVDQEGYVV